MDDMDNSLMRKRYLNLKNKLSFCSMTVQKFYSNSPLVCKNLDQNLLPKAIQFDEVTHDIVYNIGQVLGMSFLVPDDCLTYTGNVREWIKGKVGINLDQG
jgi:hypothetical protein